MRADNAVVTAIIKTDEEFLREVADRLRARMARTAQDIVEIGLDLIEVRARVGDGKFSAWIEAEFTMSRVTAYKMIKVAETFGETGVNQFTPSVLYALAAPDTTEEVCPHRGYQPRRRWRKDHRRRRPLGQDGRHA
jgi:hypothetical protein